MTTESSTIGTITIPQLAAGAVPTAIRELFIGCATDQATLALLRMSLRVRLSGAGIAEGGLQEVNSMLLDLQSLVGTSANVHSKPSPVTALDVMEQVGEGELLMLTSIV